MSAEGLRAAMLLAVNHAQLRYAIYDDDFHPHRLVAVFETEIDTINALETVFDNDSCYYAIDLVTQRKVWPPQPT